MKCDFNVERLKGKIQIDINEWYYPAESLLTVHKISGKSYATSITNAKAVGNGVEGIHEGDYIFLSKVACDVATTPTVSYKVEDKEYFNVPAEQIIGTFKDNIIDEAHFEIKNKNILFKKILKTQDSPLYIEEKDTMLGEVIETCVNSVLKIGDIVAIRDNVSTIVKFGETEYYAVEEKFVVGKFKESLKIEDMEVLNEYVLMKPYVSKNVLNSTVLETPFQNFEDLDYSDINNRNLFKVIYVDKSMESINKGDIILVNRDFTNYMYYGNEKYFVMNDKKYVLGKITERDNL